MTDECEGELTATTARTLCRPEDVYLGVLPVAHPVHKRDLAPEVVEVAKERLTVKEHAQGLSLLCRGFLAGERARDQQDGGQADRPSETLHRASGGCL